MYEPFGTKVFVFNKFIYAWYQSVYCLTNYVQGTFIDLVGSK